ncbi:TROVE domain-containing protein [Haloprofundus salinisoli]|uniref:TROVE domain-containing protein n=1 Tax=Haloprofundus salinisoli TaxID=2876193 RepID=UPI001CCAB679|nr:TROVE domain-containing protein [Haloprofundus salinisoli]
MKFNRLKNRLTDKQRTTNYEGGEAYQPATPEMGLYTVVVNNLVEDTFYREDTDALVAVVERFEPVAESNPEFTLKLAAHARNEMYLRDISQVLLVLAANHDATKPFVREYAPRVIRRADELNTVVAVQLTLFGKPIPKPLKKGIADAFHRFDRYQFAKYNNLRRDVTFRDVMNLVHPKPRDDEEREVFERLVRGGLDDYPDVEPLDAPKTWEVVISERGNTADAWRDVLPEMGLFATIRNLRNMLDAGLEGAEILGIADLDYVRESKLYPFRFYQAHEALLAAGIEDDHVQNWLSDAIERAAENLDDELGETFVAVDLSGSMTARLSARSTMTYRELSAFFGAVLMRKGATTGVFADEFEEVRAHHETPVLELVKKILARDVGGSTNGWKALRHLVEEDEAYDRVVVLTDMQLWDSTWGSEETVKRWYEVYRETVAPDTHLYVVDLSSYGDLVTPEGYEDVYNISGWSERVLDLVAYAEHPDEVLGEIEAY